MMKFFRKYNKHLLAVFMALLLVIWLGGTALEQMVRPDPGRQVIGTAITGTITEGDRERARFQTELQRMVGLSWQDAFRNPTAPADEQLDFIDWILLQREARRYGIEVRADQAKNTLTARGLPETSIRQLAARRDIATRHIYEAAAEYFAVQKMLLMFQSAATVSEPQLRVLARDLLERVSVEVVTFPAESFADPEEKFTEAELQAHFDKYKDKKAGRVGLGFGYFIEPRVRIQYIRIDPVKIKEHLKGGDAAYAKRAFSLWSDNKTTDPRFQRTPEEMEAARAADANATTNGASTEGKPPAVVSAYYETFAEARDKAIDAVKTEEAKAEADRVANRLAQMLKEPWFDIIVGPTEYKPAPDPVKTAEYYADVIARLPFNLQYPEGIEVGSVDWITQRELAEREGIGTANWPLPDGDAFPLWRLAFNVEGLATIPEDARVDRQLYLSLWQTLSRPLPGADGTIYLFRVVEAQEGRVPAKLDEVIERVVEDMRTLRGLERARKAAEAFAAAVGTSGLIEAWAKDTALVERISPDRGGYVEPPPFPRDTSSLFGVKNVIPAVGVVTDEFVEKAFELAAAADRNRVVVVDLPEQAKVAVIKGKEMFPLYDETYQFQRLALQERLGMQKSREVLLGWLNAKRVRERNQWSFGSGT